MDFVFHVTADGFPVADGEGKTEAGKFDAGQSLAVLETDAHAVLAVDAILGGALGFDDPGGEGFPGDEERFGGAFGHEADFAALAVEAGWDDFGAFVVIVEPSAEEDG
ncbi:hypothetical protein FQZ97_1080720 [compost metagenome]